MKRIIAILILLSFVLETGCSTNRYITPAATFQHSTNQTIAAISAFYSSRNSFEVQLYLSEVAADPSVEVGVTDSKGNPTPLGHPVFSPASIKARLDALSVVGVYASRLYELANTSAPADFASAASALGTNLQNLDKTFQSLGAKDPTAGSYVGPIASLVGTIGKMYLNSERDKRVKEAIEQGGPQVNTILSQIKNDMDNIFSLEVITGANEQLATAVNAYNRDRKNLSYDQRVARLAEIYSLSNAVSAATASAPSRLVSSMLDANNALLKSAQASNRDKQLSLATLNAALSAWVTQIQDLVTQIKPLVR